MDSIHRNEDVQYLLFLSKAFFRKIKNIKLKKLVGFLWNCNQEFR